MKGGEKLKITTMYRGEGRFLVPGGRWGWEINTIYILQAQICKKQLQYMHAPYLFQRGGINTMYGWV